VRRAPISVRVLVLNAPPPAVWTETSVFSVKFACRRRTHHSRAHAAAFAPRTFRLGRQSARTAPRAKPRAAAPSSRRAPRRATHRNTTSACSSVAAVMTVTATTARRRAAASRPAGECPAPNLLLESERLSPRAFPPPLLPLSSPSPSPTQPPRPISVVSRYEPLVPLRGPVSAFSASERYRPGRFIRHARDTTGRSI
jgi:hypothetical protein